MKVLQNVVEVEKEGLISLLGENVEVFCGDYIYAGKLIGVNDTCVKLENPHIVYETGAFTDKKYKDSQSMNKDYQYLNTQWIQSFGKCTKL